MSRRLSRAIALVAIVGLILAAALAVPGLPDRLSHVDAAFTPAITVRFCNGLPADFPASVPANDADLAGNPSCTDTPTPANSAVDLTTTFSVPAGQPNAAMSLSVAPGAVTSGLTITKGAKVAGFTSATTLGMLNGPCVTSMAVDSILYSSAITGAAVSPAAEGVPNRFDDIIIDADGDGFADPASPLIQSNLTIYETYLDPDLDYPGGPNGPLPPITPVARYSGGTRVPAGGDWQVFSIIMVSSSSLAQFDIDPDNRPNPLARAGRAPADGTVALILLNDPTASQASVSPINELCTPFSVTAMFKGVTPGGQTRYTTPASGAYAYGQWSMSSRDADSDGLENFLDTCPFTVNSGSDTDFDGIDNACDPTPTTNSGLGDHDSDLFVNRQDLCPLFADGGAAQRSSESQQTYLVAAPDGGPGNDAIGDACDPNPTTAHTEGSYSQTMLMVPKCIGGTDGDGDGYCSTQDLDDTSAAVGGYTVNGGPDQECCETVGDDGDGAGAFHENHYGTDPLRSCGFTSGGAPQSDTWPADLVEDNSINISDVLAFKPVFGTTVPPTPRRYDLVPSKSIDISDILYLKQFFGTSCTP